MLLTGRQTNKLLWRPVAVSPDGSLLAYLSPTSDKVIDICNLHTGAVVAELHGHVQDVLSIVFSPDGTRLATGSLDYTVKAWDFTTGALLCGHAEHLRPVHATTFSSDGRLIASGSWDMTVRLFEVATQRVVHVYGPHDDWVVEAMFSVDDEHIVTLAKSDHVDIWEVATGIRLHHFSFDDESWSRSLTFSSDIVCIRLPGDGENRSIGLWKTSVRPLEFFEADGWMYARLPGVTHRLCWLPPEWRTILASHDDIVCLREAKSSEYPNGRYIVIDMSRILAYIDRLDSDNS